MLVIVHVYSVQYPGFHCGNLFRCWSYVLQPHVVLLADTNISVEHAASGHQQNNQKG